jgi:UDP:flavonoid glycosyltransferase YjiC (YdhE family)
VFAASMVCMRVLLTTKRGAGHLGPLIPFAHALRRAGAEVLVAAPRSAREMVRAEGLPVWLFDDAPEEERDAAFAALWSQPEEARGPYVFAEVFIRLDARAALPGMLDLGHRWRPDVVMSEMSELAGPLVAESIGVPAICVGIFQQSKAEWVMGTSRVISAIDGLRAELGLGTDPEGERLFSTPYFTLVPAALEEPDAPVLRGAWRFREAEADAELEAKGRSSAAWARAEQPLVYVTFGSVVPTMELFPGMYRAAIEALGDLPVQVLVTVGRDRDPADLGPLPANVHAERWVRQRDVMSHAAAMVCHGGSGTVTMGLAAGVPMAVVPLFADQPYNAQSIAAIGAGIALEGGADAVAGLGDTVSRLLVDPAYAANAARVADHMRALPTVDVAPAIVRELVADRMPAIV